MKNLDKFGTVVSTDVLVLGGGGAGLCAGIKARETSVDVLVLDKGGIGWAGQVPLGGGEMACVYPEKVDEFCRWVAEYNGYFNNQDWTYTFAQGLTRAYLELDKLGVPFLKSKEDIVIDGTATRSVVLLETSKVMLKLKNAAVAKGVRTMDKVYIIDLLQQDGQVVGALGLGLVDGKTYIFNAKAVIIACGSCRFQAEKEMNWTLGEGPFMAYRAGAQIMNAEFRSLYRHTLKLLDGKQIMTIDPSFLYFYLENALGERVMEKQYPGQVSGKKPSAKIRMLDDLLLDAMLKEVEAGHGPIYFDISKLDLTHEEMQRLKWQPPPGFSELYSWDSLRLVQDKLGIDPYKEKIEIEPLSTGGGGPIRIDLQCRTTVDGLWGAGDSANLGSAWTGAKSVGGGMGIGFAVVSGFISGENAAKYAAANNLLPIDPEEIKKVEAKAFAPLHRDGEIDVADVIHQIHEAVIPMKYNFKREAGRLKEALEIIEKAKAKLEKVGVRDYHELSRYHQAESMALAGELTYKAALMREESRGQHQREDFPNRDDKNWLKWIIIDQKDGQPRLSTEPVPLARFKHKPLQSGHQESM